MQQPNILFITADDMNWDAVGAYGCETADTTPNIDRLAAQGMRFHYAHVTIAVCQPSRSTLMTGRYPHHSGGEGFHHLRQPGVPILPDLLSQNGYRVGILGKVPHSTPYADFQWDMSYVMQELGHGRNPDVYAAHATDFIQAAADDDQPFFLMANSHDPHRPFVGNDREEWYSECDPPAVPPSRTFVADEVVVPGFLPDLPDVRLEISEYYSSVRRCDDTVGRLLDVLDAAGVAENTLVMFLSDNGMAFPFAKTNCYLHSTRTPWLARWPAAIQQGRVDNEHFISGIDFMPTILDAAGIDHPDGIDGSSFLPLLQGEDQNGRDQVFTQFHQTAGRRNYPMRCVQDRRFGYIFNPWSNGERDFRNESQAGRTMAAMRDAAETDGLVASRVQQFLYRVPEELYDFENDPHAYHNLVEDPNHAADLERMRSSLHSWMKQNADPALHSFEQRTDGNSLEEFVVSEIARLGGQ
ncbi:MAG: sulfatase [Planctomycetota bacterium]|jgi:N-sulfoglucosamine sulfohydrolase|nr:sulfatase [Planctomycetota bacterium]